MITLLLCVFLLVYRYNLHRVDYSLCSYRCCPFVYTQGGAFSKSAGLDALIVLGGTFLGCATLAEQLAQRGDKCKVINVCGASDFCMIDPSSCIEKLHQVSGCAPAFFSGIDKRIACEKTQEIVCDASGAFGLGFDTQTKAAAELVGELSIWHDSHIGNAYVLL